MRQTYLIHTRPNKDLAVLYSAAFGTQGWVRVEVTKRIRLTRRCSSCGKRLGKKAFRPLTNKSNRMDRICEPCIEA
jgi:hypothetical protein